MASLFERSKEIKIKEGLQFDPSLLETLSGAEKAQVEKALSWDGQGFDHRVHIQDPKTGMLLKYQPYRRIADKDNGVYYVRKDESGRERRYNEHGQIIDQLDAKPKVNSDSKLSK